MDIYLLKDPSTLEVIGAFKNARRLIEHYNDYIEPEPKIKTLKQLNEYDILVTKVKVTE